MIIRKFHAVCLFGCWKKDNVTYRYKILDGAYWASDRRHVSFVKYKSVLTKDQLRDKVIWIWPIKCSTN